MIESLKMKLMEIATNDNGQIKLTSLDGLLINGYSTKVSGLGRIVEMEKDSQKTSYFVDDKFSVTELGQSLSNVGNIGDSTTITDLSIVVANKGRNTITVTINSNVQSGSSIGGYVYLLDGQVISVEKNNSYTYTNLQPGQTYEISIIAIDNIGKMKTNKITAATDTATTARYLVFEVLDHLGGEGAVINEIEVYNQSGNWINYSVPSVYESLTGGKPSYWDGAGSWSKENLMDRQIVYGSNSDGGANTAILLYNSGPNTGYWCRILIDLGSEQVLSQIKVAIGGTESRMPKNISIYGVNSYSASTYANNIAQRNNTGLSLIGSKTFTSIISTPTYFTLY